MKIGAAIESRIEAVSSTPPRISTNGGDLVVIPKLDVQVSSLLEVLPLQLLSYYINVMREFDPDLPRNLPETLTVD